MDIDNHEDEYKDIREEQYEDDDLENEQDYIEKTDTIVAPSIKFKNSAIDNFKNISSADLLNVRKPIRNISQHVETVKPKARILNFKTTLIINNNIRNIIIKKLAHFGDIKYFTLLEKILYEKYSKKHEEYMLVIARLTIFLDSSNYIGQFAKMLHSKVLNTVYTPERLIELDIVELIPEIFLNPKVSIQVKTTIYEDINTLINDTSFNMIEMYKEDYSRKIKLKKIDDSQNKKDLIFNNQIDVKSLCENPHSHIKISNIIICKENGRFYCLDIEKLLIELAQNNTAINYLTNKKLSDEIIKNLMKRYSNEIIEIQKGSPITIDTNIDLQQYINKLIEFKTIINQPDVLETVKLFGLFSMEKDYLDLLQNIPLLIRDKFDNDFLNTDKDADETIKQVNMWLDTTINQYTQSANKTIKKSTMTNTPISNEEKIMVKNYIMKKDSLSNYIYNIYYNRLINLKSVHTNSNEKDKIETELVDFKAKTSSINGIISLLDEELKLQELNKSLNNCINIAYPDINKFCVEEKNALTKLVSDLKKEIIYLTKLKKSLRLQN